MDDNWISYFDEPPNDTLIRPSRIRRSCGASTAPRGRPTYRVVRPLPVVARVPAKAETECGAHGGLRAAEERAFAIGESVVGPGDVIASPTGAGLRSGPHRTTSNGEQHVLTRQPVEHRDVSDCRLLLPTRA
jgi:hypothetical protein